MGIALMMIFVLFFIELMTVRYAGFGHSHSHDDEEHDHVIDSKHDKHKQSHDDLHNSSKDSGKESSTYDDNAISIVQGSVTPLTPGPTHIRGEDHLGHGREHIEDDDPENNLTDLKRANTESYASQLTAIFILEFGVIFHSIFIGLTLAVSGSEFITLYIVLVFHQTFEGLGLGTRLATVPWPKTKRLTPYLLAIGYGVSTPIAIAVGLAVRQSFSTGSAKFLLVNGIFDSISAGILIYTGLVELMAHEFMFSPSMRKASISTVISAFGSMVLGAGRSHSISPTSLV
jgi:zinc transporter 1/2/3